MKWVDAYDEDQAPIQIAFYEKGEQDPQYWPRMGQRLYYKDKRTGEIKSGTVIKPGNFTFWFCFDSGHVKLDKSVMGKRLFVSDFAAYENGKMEKN